MKSSVKNLFVTGLPGVGKTTLIKKLGEKLAIYGRGGFYTGEIREKGIRRGFSLTSFDGEDSILSHINIKSAFRVGKYGVDIDRFDKFLDTIDFFNPKYKFVIIDEIGKMECMSEKFRQLLVRILNSDKHVIATIALKGSGFIERLKRREDSRLFMVNSNNRDELADEIFLILLNSNLSENGIN